MTVLVGNHRIGTLHPIRGTFSSSRNLSGCPQGIFSTKTASSERVLVEAGATPGRGASSRIMPTGSRIEKSKSAKSRQRQIAPNRAKCCYTEFPLNHSERAPMDEAELRSSLQPERPPSSSNAAETGWKRHVRDHLLFREQLRGQHLPGSRRRWKRTGIPEREYRACEKGT